MRFLLVVLATVPVFAAADPSQFAARVYRSSRGDTTPYRLFIPPNYAAKRSYPLVLWLHGAGGRGNDNEKQIAGGNSAGATVWTSPANQARHPAFVLAPQCPEGEMWTSRLRDLVDLVKEVQRTYNIDSRRLYVAGQSLGGYGTWALITAYPDMFAAAVPICGGGDETKAKVIATPVWAFHGELDRVVSVERSRTMVTAVRRAGGRAQLTEYKGADHVIWNRAFAEPKLLPWVFAQKLRTR